MSNILDQLVFVGSSFSHFFLSLPFSVLGLTKYNENDIVADWQPPGYVFAIVWPILYLLFGIINLKVEFSSKYSINFKNKVIGESIIESLLQALWLLVTAKIAESRTDLQYQLGFFVMLGLLFYAFKVRANTLSIDRSLTLLYLPYKLWISFATILSFQQLTKLNKN
jgi:translocator protein